MKKFIAFVVAMTMVISLVTIPVFATAQTAPLTESGSAKTADAASFTVEAPASVHPGEEFNATVSVSGDYAAHGLNLQLNYDADTFEVVKITRGEVLATVSMELGGTVILDHTTISGSIRLGIMMPTDPFSDQGTIFTAKFMVKDGAQSGTFAITPVVTEFFSMPLNAAQTPIEHTETAAEVTVVAAEATEAPTAAPTEAPTEAPTVAPTEAPTVAPTEAPSIAPDQVAFYVDAPEFVEAGEEFQVSIRIEGEFESHGLNLQFNYDQENFTVLGTTRGPVLNAVGDLGGTQLVDYQTIPGSMRIGIIMPDAPFSESGTILTVNFKASEAIADGSYDFAPVVTEFIYFPIGESSQDIDNVVFPATVKVGTEPTVPPVEPTNPPVPEAVTISVGNYEAVPGALVSVPVVIRGEYEANGLSIYFNYDKELLTVESTEDGPLMVHVQQNLSGFNVLDYQTIPGSIRFSAVAPLADKTFNTQGTIFTVNFRVSENAQPGTVIDLDIDVPEFIIMPDNHDIPIECECVDGTITIIDQVAPSESPAVPSESPVVPTNPPVDPTTPPTPPTGTATIAIVGLAAVALGGGAVLFRKKED